MHVRAYRRGSRFTRFAKVTAHLAGQPATFCIAVAIIVVWAATGPLFGFSDTWQLIINTGTTIVTFLMVFLIQSTQNRDAEAVQVKLDEIRQTYTDMAQKAREVRARRVTNGGSRTNTPARRRE